MDPFQPEASPLAESPLCFQLGRPADFSRFFPLSFVAGPFKVIFEKSPSAGRFFRRFPIHRMLISDLAAVSCGDEIEVMATKFCDVHPKDVQPIDMVQLPMFLIGGINPPHFAGGFDANSNFPPSISQDHS